MVESEKRCPIPCDSGESTTTISRLSFEDESRSPSSRNLYINSLSCRICWTGINPKKGILVAPCKCKGTQKYVHIDCLHLWQMSVREKDRADERAYRCGVCRSKYTIGPPLSRRLKTSRHLLRCLGAIVCTLALAFGYGSPWLHIAGVILGLLAIRTRSIFAIIVILFGVCSLVLHLRRYRFHLQMMDGQLGITVVRHGAAVPGLGVGSLLVASDRLQHSDIFRDSVVMITEFGEGGGVKGVVLNQPLRLLSSRGTDFAMMPEWNNLEPESLRHYLGGPVGMPGVDVQPVMVVLHPYGYVEGARPVVHEFGSEGKLESAQYYVGGRLSDVMEFSSCVEGRRRKIFKEKLSSLTKRDETGRRNNARRNEQDAKKIQISEDEGSLSESASSSSGTRIAAGEDACGRVLVFHGVSTWVPGQIEGEIRSGLWGYIRRATFDDIRDASQVSEHLRDRLLESGRALWL